ncbi:hypothetical protein SAMN05444004_10890 [Jannaschia faecimaris]|uniref:Uncharacterized protein n=1 Tax=Jannaschia faecimaris TaxID=1244108 RepID=A0A1H3RG40_9RHOB|nr:hypothetical protein [Jannaschia faecimaris]SDZ24201.1 hypothetical protein SAMN05444004_10890 [Jannaschia faecimaris]
MQIAIHLGAHCTDEDLILKTLSENGALLLQHSVAIPAAGKARPAIRKALQGGGNLVPGMGNPLMQELLEETEADRLILSYEGFLGVYAKVLSGRSIYSDAAKRTQMLRDIFLGQDVSFHLAMRNPATFVPALFEASSATDFNAFLSGHDLSQITWSEPITQIRAACPDVPLTIWCNEDLPLIWPDVLHGVAGIDAKMKGEDAILRQIMTPAGFRRFENYIRDNPTPDQSTWRKVVTAFLGKYADEAAVAPDIALPGWSEEMIAGLSDLYERDVARLRSMDDLTFIVP